MLRVQGSGCRHERLALRVEGSGFTVYGLRGGVEGFDYRRRGVGEGGVVVALE